MARRYDALLDALGVGAGAVFALVALATSGDVALRALAGDTVKGLVELVEYALFAVTFLAAPWLLRHDGHVQVDFAVERLPPRARTAVRRAGDALGLALSALLGFYALRVAWAAWQSGSIVLKTMIFPEWWIFAVVAVSMALLALEFARRLAAPKLLPHGARDL